MIEKVRIGAVDFAVCYDSALALSRSRIGEVNTNTSEILLEQSVELQKQYQVLLHEIIHAVLMSSGIDLGDIEEQTIDVISYGALQVIRDNPQLIREILGLWSA